MNFILKTMTQTNSYLQYIYLMYRTLLYWFTVQYCNVASMYIFQGLCIYKCFLFLDGCLFFFTSILLKAEINEFCL